MMLDLFWLAGPFAVGWLPTSEESAVTEHRYLSTSCLHADLDDRPELHDECKIDTRRYDGSYKVGSTCKWCTAKCVCACHGELEALM